MKSNMRILMIGLVIVGFGGSVAFSDVTSSYISRKKPLAQAAPQQPSQMPTPMTQEETDFASKLSDLHKMIFTKVMTPSLRAEAMNMYAMQANRMKNKSKMMMTQDEAVEQTIKNNRGVAMTSTGAPSTSSGTSKASPNTQGASNAMSGSNGGSSGSPTSDAQSNTPPKKKKYYWD